MASIHSYEIKSGQTRWYVAYRGPDGKQTSKRGFKRKRDAVRYSENVSQQIHSGNYISPKMGAITLAEVAKPWLAEKKVTLKPSSYRVYELSWRNHVEPAFGARKISSIVTSEVRAWITDLSTDGSRATVSRAFGVLAGVLDTAVEDGRIEKNPARPKRPIAMPARTRQRRPYLTHTQVKALAETSKYSEIVYVLAYTGMRWGELSGLKVRNIDATTRRILVIDNAVKVGTSVVEGTVKTGSSRTIGYPSFLDSAIAAAIRGKSPTAYAFGPGDKPLPLPDSKGWFAGAVSRCARKDPQFPSTLTPHGLRHTAASLAIQTGANPKYVQNQLGHESAAMTLDTYADLFSTDVDVVAAALGAARDAALATDDDSRDNTVTT